jgi:hypothetical protein
MAQEKRSTGTIKHEESCLRNGEASLLPIGSTIQAGSLRLRAPGTH